MFVMDLDRGMEIFIRAIGGSYFALEAGVPTGLNPFQLPDTPGNREFLYSLVGMCGADENGKTDGYGRKRDSGRRRYDVQHGLRTPSFQPSVTKYSRRS